MLQLLTGSSSALVIPSASRVHGALSWFKNAQARLILTAIDQEKSTAQQTVISFRDNATEYYDRDFDSRFLQGFAPQFYSVAGSEILSTNTLPDFTGRKYIQLGFAGNGSGNYNISLSRNDLTGINGIYLVDEQEGNVADLIRTPVYNFRSSAGDNPSRFKLLLTQNPEVTPDAKAVFSVYVSDGVIYLTSLANNDREFRISDVTGRLLTHGHTRGKNLLSVNARNYPRGLYIVAIDDGEYFQKEKFLLN
ncbi:MAG: hypothetical protein IPF68_17180 [Bacteroidales bacterium]|nr:hypothetical protein [Bacteroidales bacterium]